MDDARSKLAESARRPSRAVPPERPAARSPVRVSQRHAAQDCRVKLRIRPIRSFLSEDVEVALRVEGDPGGGVRVVVLDESRRAGDVPGGAVVEIVSDSREFLKPND